MKRIVRKTTKKKAFDKTSHLEEAILPKLLDLSRRFGVHPPLRNQCHLQPTKLEFDFCWLDHKIAVEIQGGINGRKCGGHNSPDGLRRDYYKNSLAQTSGWILLFFPPEYCLDAANWRVAERILKLAFKLRGL